jgi:hypothetical protein
LIDFGFSKEKVNYVFTPRKKETAQEIIDLANKGDFSAIVLNRSPGKIRKFFTTSVSKKVAKALVHKKLYIVG